MRPVPDLGTCALCGAPGEFLVMRGDAAAVLCTPCLTRILVGR